MISLIVDCLCFLVCLDVGGVNVVMNSVFLVLCWFSCVLLYMVNVLLVVIVCFLNRYCVMLDCLKVFLLMLCMKEIRVLCCGVFRGVLMILLIVVLVLSML